MANVRWGVISTANIGVKAVLPAMQQGERCKLVAVSSRDLDTAKRTAEKLGVEKAYGSYEELLADPDIDAVYNPLPNHLHVDWSIKALEAGKHVLCEKPIGLDAKDADRLIKANQKHPKLKVMEAFMYRFHPQWSAVLDWIRLGEIGELKNVQSFFSYFNDDPDNIRNRVDIGGGGLMDIGCYCISFSRYLFGRLPKRVVGLIERDPKMRTDRLASGMLDFGSGSASFTCSTQLAPYQRVHIFGTSGRIEVEIPVNAPNNKETRIWLTNNSGTQEKTFPICDQCTLQGDAFSKAILNDEEVPTSLQDATENMRVIDAIFESEKQKGWISL